ncbi:MAG: putative ABC transporter permease [Cellulosilyticaceae bacterium]
MKSVREIWLYFLMYGYMGWLLESIYASIRQSKWIRRRGVMTQYFLPLYGICGVLIIRIFDAMPYKWLAMLTSGIVITGLEYVVGIVLDKTRDVRLWNYTGIWGNIKGYVCLPFTLIWCSLAGMLALVVHPVVMHIQEQLSISTQWGVIAIGVMGCLCDIMLMMSRDALQ